MPKQIAKGLCELTRLDSEFLGVLTVNDRELHPHEDELISSYITLEVGDENSVEGTEEEDEILNEFTRQTDSRHRYFHTHPIGTLDVENANPESYSPEDLETFTDNQKYWDDPHHWHLVVYHDRSDPRPGYMLMTSSDWSLEFEDWGFNDRDWNDVGAKVYDDLISRGIEEVDPYEEARKIA